MGERDMNRQVEMKHTPRPWVAEKGSQSFDNITALHNGDRVVIARVYTWGDEQWANARLIAAAPEILESLLMMISWAQATVQPQLGLDSLPHGFNKAMKAIEKAVGA